MWRQIMTLYKASDFRRKNWTEHGCQLASYRLHFVTETIGVLQVTCEMLRFFYIEVLVILKMSRKVVKFGQIIFFWRNIQLRCSLIEIERYGWFSTGKSFWPLHSVTSFTERIKSACRAVPCIRPVTFVSGWNLINSAVIEKFFNVAVENVLCRITVLNIGIASENGEIYVLTFTKFTGGWPNLICTMQIFESYSFVYAVSHLRRNGFDVSPL